MSLVEVKVPDIGDFKNIPIIEILVKPGDVVKAEDPLIALESDKATMEVPAPGAGTVKEIKVKVGDKVSEGTLVLMLDAAAQPAAAATPAPQPAAAAQPVAAAPPPASAPQPAAPASAPSTSSSPTASLEPIDEAKMKLVHAGPSVRGFARELGADLSKVTGSGPKGRILREDVQAYVKTELTRPRGGSGSGLGFNLLPMPQVDFAKFGPVQTQALSRIKKLSGANLHRNWVAIPHVTQQDEADITELEAFRKSQS
ncbi:MAG: E3 binding domain-containing protein, partial [Betaproteobacteria bacterium]|nr:E3 binding domain-containing protein [Betaproteobacteria bacterium]